MAILEAKSEFGIETKPKLMYMAGCALILHFFVVEHISASRIA